VGVTQVVKLHLEPSAAQVELLRGYCGTARAAYNILLYQVRANLGQRAAEKTHDIADADLTPALSWRRFDLEKLLRANREQALPWHEQVPYLVLDRSAHHLAAAWPDARPVRRSSPGTARITARAPAWPRSPSGRPAPPDSPAVAGCSRCRARTQNAGSSQPQQAGLPARGWSKTTAAGGPRS
jgi:hypothetical protein